MSEKESQVSAASEDGNAVQYERRKSNLAAAELVNDVPAAEVDAFIEQMERDLAPVAKKASFFRPSISPKYFTYVMVAFASMGGMLFGLDQSLISGANLTMPEALGLDTDQNSLVNSFMPLGAIFGSVLLGPANEWFGRKGAILLAILFYTVGAGLEAGAINYGMMLAGRVVLGLGLGLEVGTVPVYVAESVARKVRGNLVSLYQFNIALGEVLGFVVAAIFIRVEGSWRYILGSSLVFSTIMFCGYVPRCPLFIPVACWLVPYWAIGLTHWQHALPPGKPPISYAQGQDSRGIPDLEAHPRHIFGRDAGRVLHHDQACTARNR
jgi:MFS family permease